MRYDLKLLERPQSFTAGNMTLWDNEYIAANVLKKHLQKDMDSGSRKENTITNTVQWLNNIFPQKGRILDIGCGPGLYAQLLYDYGFYYHGIDISKYQIAYAKMHTKNIDVLFETLDFRQLNPSGVYDIVLLLYGIYSFYKLEERIKLLRTLKSILCDNGSVLVEVFTPSHYKYRQESTDWKYITKGGFWSNEPYLELNAFYRYDDLGLVLIQAARVNDTIDVWNSWIQTFTPEMLQSEFETAGFTEFKFYSSCTGQPYHNMSEVLCMIAR